MEDFKLQAMLQSLFHEVTGLQSWNFTKKRLQHRTCNCNKSSTPQWVFFTFFKLHKWYQIAQSFT